MSLCDIWSLVPFSLLLKLRICPRILITFHCCLIIDREFWCVFTVILHFLLIMYTVPCGPGTFYSSTSGSCTVCGAGTFQYGIEQVSCQSCTSGSAPNTDKTGCRGGTYFYLLLAITISKLVNLFLLDIYECKWKRERRPKRNILEGTSQLYCNNHML